MKQNSTKIAVKSLQNLTKRDQDTGKFVNAQKFGKNISIGITIILAGIFYIIGGFSLIFTIFVACITVLFVGSLILYTLIKLKVI